jgi:hypothetical protein
MLLQIQGQVLKHFKSQASQMLTETFSTELIKGIYNLVSPSL